MIIATLTALAVGLAVGFVIGFVSALFYVGDSR